MDSKEKTVGLHHRMSQIKMELSKCKIPKSGHNKFSNFYYHELTDFMPFINELNVKHGVNAYPKFLKQEGICVLTLVNSDDKEDFYDVVIPYIDAEMLSKGGGASVVDAIQRLGSTITYNRRYLYQSAYDIVESDGVDSLPPNESEKEKTPTPQPKQEQLPTTPVNASNPLGLGETLPKADIETFNKMMRLVVSGKRNYTNDIELKYDLNTSQKIQLKNAENERNAKTK
jgi:hypothetical protein